VPQQRSLEKFKKYTESWKRPAAMEKESVFQVWATDEGPPSHSIPPHLVAKAAAGLGAQAFEMVHERLLKAYFTENRDIAEPDVLNELWEELGLPSEAFEKSDDPEILKEVMTEHNEAVQNGVSGVPAILMEGVPGVLVGAQEEEFYRRLIRNSLNTG